MCSPQTASRWSMLLTRHSKRRLLPLTQKVEVRVLYQCSTYKSEILSQNSRANQALTPIHHTTGPSGRTNPYHSPFSPPLYLIMPQRTASTSNKIHCCSSNRNSHLTQCSRPASRAYSGTYRAGPRRTYGGGRRSGRINSSSSTSKSLRLSCDRRGETWKRYLKNARP